MEKSRTLAIALHVTSDAYLYERTKNEKPLVNQLSRQRHRWEATYSGIGQEKVESPYIFIGECASLYFFIYLFVLVPRC